MTMVAACNRQDAAPIKQPNASVASTLPQNALSPPGDGMSFVDGSQPDNFKAPEFMQLQVALDAMGFSPGIIDGKMGLSTRNAIVAFQEQSALPLTGKIDEATAARLQSALRVAPARIITLPADFATIGFTEIPKTAEEKAKMANLGYQDVWERIGERFHTTKEVIRALNPELQPPVKAAETASEADLGLVGGAKIRVPNIGADAITPGLVDDPDWQATLVSLGVGTNQPQASKIVVDKSDGTLKTFDAAGKLLAAFTATIGSRHDPLPLGEWKITNKAYNPHFAYDPTLLWDVPDNHEKLQLPPGPNGPVGVAWIALSKKHYGIHGTADPETIGRAESHGCVRLTNWDVARLMQMVTTKTQVVFQA